MWDSLVLRSDVRVETETEGKWDPFRQTVDHGGGRVDTLTLLLELEGLTPVPTSRLSWVGLAREDGVREDTPVVTSSSRHETLPSVVDRTRDETGTRVPLVDRVKRVPIKPKIGRNVLWESRSV